MEVNAAEAARSHEKRRGEITETPSRFAAVSIECDTERIMQSSGLKIETFFGYASCVGDSSTLQRRPEFL
jgi:hypothetical protein